MTVSLIYSGSTIASPKTFLNSRAFLSSPVASLVLPFLLLRGYRLLLLPASSPFSTGSMPAACPTSSVLAAAAAFLLPLLRGRFLGARCDFCAPLPGVVAYWAAPSPGVSVFVVASAALLSISFLCVLLVFCTKRKLFKNLLIMLHTQIRLLTIFDRI